MANHTRVFHGQPDFPTIQDAVRKQFYSGEGAIQYVPEAVARANVDLLCDETSRRNFLCAYNRFGRADAARYLKELASHNGVELSQRIWITAWIVTDSTLRRNHWRGLPQPFGSSPEHARSDRLRGLDKAFRAAGLAVAALLHHKFKEPRYQRSRGGSNRGCLVHRFL